MFCHTKPTSLLPCLYALSTSYKVTRMTQISKTFRVFSTCLPYAFYTATLYLFRFPCLEQITAVQCLCLKDKSHSSSNIRLQVQFLLDDTHYSIQVVTFPYCSYFTFAIDRPLKFRIEYVRNEVELFMYFRKHGFTSFNLYTYRRSEFYFVIIIQIYQEPFIIV